MRTIHYITAFAVVLSVTVGCRRNTPQSGVPFSATRAVLGPDFPLDPPLAYATSAPGYITKDTRGGAEPDDRLATVGRVLFYDPNLSLNNTISCSSCHLQAFAFSDTAARSVGLDGGFTGRHSMRLVNNRFEDEEKRFWDERAIDLEDQVVQPIQDHIEMGFSGTGVQAGTDSLLSKLTSLSYYNELFAWAFDGDSAVTMHKIGICLTDFVSSIESFDSKFDTAYAAANANINGPFPSFTQQENLGKHLFLAPPVLDNQNIRTAGGAGCAGCHRPPEFDIDPNSRNNGVDHQAGNPSAFDPSNTRSPTLRDIMGPGGLMNGPAMHTGDFVELETVIEHYNHVIPSASNATVDPRVMGVPPHLPRQLELTSAERQALEAFLKTLTGSNIYADVRWSNPF